MEPDTEGTVGTEETVDTVGTNETGVLVGADEDTGVATEEPEDPLFVFIAADWATDGTVTATGPLAALGLLWELGLFVEPFFAKNGGECREKSFLGPQMLGLYWVRFTPPESGTPIAGADVERFTFPEYPGDELGVNPIRGIVLFWEDQKPGGSWGVASMVLVVDEDESWGSSTPSNEIAELAELISGPLEVSRAIPRANSSATASSDMSVWAYCLLQDLDKLGSERGAGKSETRFRDAVVILLRFE